MKIDNKHLILFVAILLVAGFLNIRQKSFATDIENQKTVQTFEANLVIKNKTDSNSFNINQYIGKTVLQTTTGILNGNIKYNGNDKEAVVTSINGVDANPKKNEYWSLSINGTEIATEAAVSVVPNHSNVVWELKVK